MAASKRGKGSAAPPILGGGVPPIDAAGSAADRGAPASDAAWSNVGRGALVMIGAAGSTAGRGGGAIGGAGSTVGRGGGENGGAGSTLGSGGGETGGAGATGVGLAATGAGAAAPQWEQNLAPSAIRWPHCAQNMESLRRKCWRCGQARLCAGPADDSTGDQRFNASAAARPPRRTARPTPPRYAVPRSISPFARRVRPTRP